LTGFSRDIKIQFTTSIGSGLSGSAVWRRSERFDLECGFHARQSQNPMRAGWIYLAVVIDLFSRSIVGWSVGDRLATAGWRLLPCKRLSP